MTEDAKNGGNEKPKEEMVEIGWKISPSGVMTITVSLADASSAIYTLDRANRHINRLVDMAEQKLAAQRQALSGNNQQAKQNKSFFQKHFQ